MSKNNLGLYEVELEAEIERLRAVEFATRDENERLRASNAELLAAVDQNATVAVKLERLNAELVEVLKRAEGFLVNHHGPEDKWILDDIRAAIAKAKG